MSDSNSPILRQKPPAEKHSPTDGDDMSVTSSDSDSPTAEYAPESNCKASNASSLTEVSSDEGSPPSSAQSTPWPPKEETVVNGTEMPASCSPKHKAQKGRGHVARIDESSTHTEKDDDALRVTPSSHLVGNTAAQELSPQSPKTASPSDRPVPDTAEGSADVTDTNAIAREGNDDCENQSKTEVEGVPRWAKAQKEAARKQKELHATRRSADQSSAAKDTRPNYNPTVSYKQKLKDALLNLQEYYKRGARPKIVPSCSTQDTSPHWKQDPLFWYPLRADNTTAELASGKDLQGEQWRIVLHTPTERRDEGCRYPSADPRAWPAPTSAVHRPTHLGGIEWVAPGGEPRFETRQRLRKLWRRDSNTGCLNLEKASAPPTAVASAPPKAETPGAGEQGTSQPDSAIQKVANSQPARIVSQPNAATLTDAAPKVTGLQASASSKKPAGKGTTVAVAIPNIKFRDEALRKYLYGRIFGGVPN